MSKKLAVVYLGPKKEKRIARGGLRLTFPIGSAVEVEEQIAFDLLRHSTVFASPEEAEKQIKARLAADEESERRRAELAEQQAKEAVLNSYLVKIDGETVDISKFTKAKLATVIQAESLNVDANKPEIKEGEEKQDALRNRVREALHEKYGNPELDNEGEE
ncbi:TPA: hypothetical protein ACOJPC_003129 [Vibrio fluvialis]|uniref:hypothetical protein n=1 Tax=Vibrio fluvialis TaxID=676 RepID=UPI001F363FC7|nr:hypothetical protein [Vibrio fluvialis]MCE7580933.1 hypothetical protein [Vibrio fluvialis]WDY54280.1 hypothetical protein PUN47_20740 [Vibrio fluvialis]